jgi:hypothetical protein
MIKAIQIIYFIEGIHIFALYKLLFIRYILINLATWNLTLIYKNGNLIEHLGSKEERRWCRWGALTIEEYCCQQWCERKSCCSIWRWGRIDIRHQVKNWFLIIWNSPVRRRCNYCNVEVVTYVEHEGHPLFLLIAILVMLIFGFLSLIILPIGYLATKNAVHRCSRCL